MRIFNALLGFVVSVAGIILVCLAIWARVHLSPSRIIWQTSIGVILTLLGSTGILTGFKGDSNLSNNKVLEQQSPGTWVLYGLFFIHLSVLVFQVHELLRYSAEIEPHMQTMTSQGDPSVIAFFQVGVFLMPILCQFILLPLIWFGILGNAKDSWRGGIIAMIATWNTSFSLFASFMAFGYMISTFD